MSERLKGMALCALAMVTVGSTVVASKVIAGGLPPFTATALRFAMALPVFLLLLRLTRWRCASGRGAIWWAASCWRRRG